MAQRKVWKQDVTKNLTTPSPLFFSAARQSLAVDISEIKPLIQKPDTKSPNSHKPHGRLARLDHQRRSRWACSWRPPMP